MPRSFTIGLTHRLHHLPRLLIHVTVPVVLRFRSWVVPATARGLHVRSPFTDFAFFVARSRSVLARFAWMRCSLRFVSARSTCLTLRWVYHGFSAPHLLRLAPPVPTAARLRCTFTTGSLRAARTCPLPRRIGLHGLHHVLSHCHYLLHACNLRLSRLTLSLWILYVVDVVTIPLFRDLRTISFAIVYSARLFTVSISGYVSADDTLHLIVDFTTCATITPFIVRFTAMYVCTHLCIQLILFYSGAHFTFGFCSYI